MRERIRSLCALAISVAQFAVVTAEAADVIHLTLRDLVARNVIVRGNVVAADEGMLSAGGGNIPVSAPPHPCG